MSRTIEARMSGAALAALFALGLAACGDDAQQDLEAAADDIEAAAEDVGAAVADAAEDAGDAIEDATDNMADDDGSLRTPSPDGARVYFVNLDDGDVVASPLTIEFGAENIGVTEAGDRTDGTGHHHLLIDTTVDDLDLDAPIPNDDTHRHFGMGQTETTVELTPGEHTLQLVMGDWTHIPHDPVVASDVITVTVE